MRWSAADVRWVSRADDIPASAWESCFAPPHEGIWLYRAIERGRMEDQFDFHYAVLSRDKAVAILPAFRMNVPIELLAPKWIVPLLRLFPNLRERPTLFIGSPCAEAGRVGVAPGTAFAEVLPAFHQAILEKAAQQRVRIVAWKDFPDAYRDSFEPLVQDGVLYRIPSYPGTSIRLPPGGGFDAYLRTLNSARRNKLRSKLRRGSARGRLDAGVVTHPSDAELDEIFGLILQTYAKSRVKFERPTLDYVRELAGQDNVQFVVLRDPATARLAAVMTCFRSGQRIYAKYSGFERSYGRDWFVYFRLWRAVVEWAMESGAGEIQSGQTGYAAKLDLGHALEPHYVFGLNRIKIAHWIYRRVVKQVTWASLDPELACYLRAHPGLLPQ